MNQLRGRPLTPGPSPALGRGEPMSIEFLERHRVSSLYFAILSRWRHVQPAAMFDQMLWNGE